jgi:hypothetical protein
VTAPTPAEIAAELHEARLQLADAERVHAMVADNFTSDGPARLSRRMAVEVLVAQHRVALWAMATRQLESHATLLGLNP